MPKAVIGIKLEWRLLMLFCVSVTIRLLTAALTGFGFDDAYITYRTARNLAMGLGFAYNPGHMACATTTPLYTFLITPCFWLGIDPLLWSRILNSLVGSASSVLVYLLLKGRVREGLAWFAAISLALMPSDIMLSFSGMEAPVIAFLVLFASWLYLQEKYWWLGLFTGLLFISRPDGIIAAGLFLLAIFIFKRKGTLQVLIPLVFIAGAWLLFAKLTFGSFIPDTLKAKWAFFSANKATFAHQLTFIFNYLALSLPLVPLAILAWVLGAWHCLWHRRELLVAVIWSSGILLGHLVSFANISYWYLGLATPVLLICLALGVEQFLARIIPGAGKLFAKRIIIVIVALLFSANLVWQFSIVEPNSRSFSLFEKHLHEIGRWFGENDVPKERVIAVEAIGVIGFDSDNKILDTFGLASPEMLSHIRENQIADQIIIRDFAPDYLITSQDIPLEEIPGYEKKAAFKRSDFNKRGIPKESYIYGKIGL